MPDKNIITASGKNRYLKKKYISVARRGGSERAENYVFLFVGVPFYRIKKVIRRRYTVTYKKSGDVHCTYCTVVLLCVPCDGASARCDATPAFVAFGVKTSLAAPATH